MRVHSLCRGCGGPWVVGLVCLVGVLVYLRTPDGDEAQRQRRCVPWGQPNNQSRHHEQDVYSSSVEFGHGVSSTSGAFMVHTHAWPALQRPQADAKVCLATQASVDRLHWLPWLLEAWAGPVSIALYTPGADYAAAALLLNYFRRCYPMMEERVTFHVLYPKNKRPVLVSHNLNIYDFNCTHPEETVNLILENLRDEEEEEDDFVKFPQNHLRNLARKSCDTLYGLVLDIDMIPSPFMYEKLNLFLQKGSVCPKCAMIIPVYEILETEELLPANKEALMQFIFENKARRYHIEVYELNQGNNNLQLWEAAGNRTPTTAPPLFWSFNDVSWMKSSRTTASLIYKELPYRELYTIRKYVEFWEPVVVLPEDAPGFDERFVGFGFNRNSQIYELHMRGYTFRMLDEPFLSHWGFQTQKHYSQHRYRQIKENLIRYEAFKRELTARYAVPATAHQVAAAKAPKPLVIRKIYIKIRDLMGNKN